MGVTSETILIHPLPTYPNHPKYPKPNNTTSKQKQKPKHSDNKPKRRSLLRVLSQPFLQSHSHQHPHPQASPYHTTLLTPTPTKTKIKTKAEPSSRPSLSPPSLPANQTPFFTLPLSLREKIYSYVLGPSRLLHILPKRNPKTHLQTIGYRTCRSRCTGRNPGENCVMSRCKEYLNPSNGFYFGRFGDIGRLLRVCWDIYNETLPSLYHLTTFEFSSSSSLHSFSTSIPISSLNLIRSISINFLPSTIFYPPSSIIPIQSHSPNPNPYDTIVNQWTNLWQTLSQMKGLEELDVRFRFEVEKGGWSEEEVLKPVRRVFEGVERGICRGVLVFKGGKRGKGGEVRVWVGKGR